MIACDAYGMCRMAILLGLLALPGDGAFGAEPKVVVAVAQNGEAFIVDAAMDIQIPLKTVWEVLTDFDNLTSILKNLTSSKVVRRNGDTLIVRQEGVARWGLFSFSFVSERELRLEPMSRILAKQVSGSLKRMESEANIIPLAQGVQIKYHAESVPDSFLARMFGATFVRQETEKHFLAMASEMTRRQAAAESAKPAAELPASEAPAKPAPAGLLDENAHPTPVKKVSP
jgi:hypothetical protein